MSTTAEVTAAWIAQVASNTELRAITKNLLFYTVNNDSEDQTAKLRHNQEINFVTFDITRTTALKNSGCADHIFRVNVTHSHQHTSDGSAQSKIKAALELIDSLVLTELSLTWSDTVDAYNPETSILQLAQTVIDNCNCWQGTYSYSAKKFVEL